MFSQGTQCTKGDGIVGNKNPIRTVFRVLIEPGFHQIVAAIRTVFSFNHSYACNFRVFLQSMVKIEQFMGMLIRPLEIDTSLPVWDGEELP